MYGLHEFRETIEDAGPRNKNHLLTREKIELERKEMLEDMFEIVERHETKIKKSN
jgi:uncharacterized membrane protein YgaE (UPF0421/DUF939 family)